MTRWEGCGYGDTPAAVYCPDCRFADDCRWKEHGLTPKPEEGVGVKEHRWSGWPGAWCLDCGKEDRREVELVGEGTHRYSDEPHAGKACTRCAAEDEACVVPQ